MIQSLSSKAPPRSLLHISNTDISSDSRILKQLSSLSDLEFFSVHAIGVSKPDKAFVEQLIGVDYRSLQLWARVIRWSPRPIRYFIEIVEFTIRAVLLGWRIRATLVHCHDAFSLPSGWILKQLLGARLVYDAHELESNKNGQTYILSKATLMIEKICWSKIDLLVSVSDSIIKWYIKNIGEKASVLVLNSPILSGNFFNQPLTKTNKSYSYLRDKFNIPGENLVFVYLGMLSKGRGIEICLESFSSGPKSAHVVFVGSGELESEVVRFAERNKNIHFHPAVPHDQVVSLISGANYGLCLVENVSLSDYYCLPNKLFEYSFSRLTVLASDFPDIGRVVRQYSLGFCCDPTPEGVSLALGKLIGIRPERPSADLTELSWNTQAARLKGAYQNLLGLRG